MPIYKNIHTEFKNHILYVTITREDKLNALNTHTLQELHQIFDEANQDSEIKVVIITGSGTKAFVAGADIVELVNLTQEDAVSLSKTGQNQVFDLIEKLSKPVIAAINGFALGGGLELAMACHIRVASQNAQMGLPEVSLGLIPGYGGTQRLPILVGKGKAIELICTGDMITAQEAQKIGLVNHVVVIDDLLKTCENIAYKIINQTAPFAIKQALLAINAAFDKHKNGFEQEMNSFGLCFTTEDCKEGIEAFLQKRKANFKGY